jgi:hypothetical protein
MGSFTFTHFSSNFTTSVIFRIIRSYAKFFKFDVNLLLIQRDDFFRANVNNFTFYTEHGGLYASLFINSVLGTPHLIMTVSPSSKLEGRHLCLISPPHFKSILCNLYKRTVLVPYSR